MDKPKAATATRAVVSSILSSISITFALIGTINVLAYSKDGTPYFIIAGIFALLWAGLRVLKPSRKISS